VGQFVKLTDYPISLYFVYYNFATVHQTLRVTPAMEAGVADHVWTVREIVEMAVATVLAKAS
jgi:hypothetical protein